MVLFVNESYVLVDINLKKKTAYRTLFQDAIFNQKLKTLHQSLTLISFIYV